MKTAKKALSVLLSLTMLLGVFSLMASALAPDSAIDLYVKTDKTTYNPGEEVIISIGVRTIEEVGDIYCGGQYSVGFSSDGFEPLANDIDYTKHKITALQGGITTASMIILPAGYLEYEGTIGEQNKQNYNWDSVITPVLVSQNIPIDCSNEVQYIASFALKVKDDAKPGEYTFGLEKDSFDLCVAYVEDVTNGGIYGNFVSEEEGTDFGFGTTYNYGFPEEGFCKVTIAGASTGPSVDKASTAGAQVKFTTNAPELNGVDDDFKLRIKSEITQADWDTYFANTAEGGNNAITEVGIVAYQGTDGFDAETAKKVVNGESTEKYSTAKTDYIQKTATNAYFGAIINLKHTTCNYDITYMGYVKYTDGEGQPQVAFYKTSYEAGVSTNYDTAVSTFLAQ